MYEFIQKLAKKKKMGFQPGTNMLAIVAAARHPPPHLLRQCPFYLYTIQ